MKKAKSKNRKPHVPRGVMSADAASLDTLLTPTIARGANTARVWRCAAPLLLVTVGWLAYANTFGVPLVFDDLNRVERNAAIRTIWPVGVPMANTNRPLGMFTFAVNYAWHGYRVWGYHAVNLAIHLAAGLLLLGIVRRTLAESSRTEVFRSAATPLALTIALVWLVHPLQTESVTYIVQRLESLMSLCYLATLYGLIRAQQSARPLWWYAGAVGSCAFGMGTKEVMVTAPLLILLYDRVFIADGWRAIFARRSYFYLSLAATWGVLAWSMLHWQEDYSSGLIGAVDQLSPLSYLLSQAGVLVHYLQLCLWPLHQCLDYAWPAANGTMEIVLPLLLVGGLLGATVWALVWRPAWGYLGCVFFVVLAPTSSIVPIHDLAVEHRMYLPSVAVIAAGVLAVYVVSERVLRQRPSWSRGLPVARYCLAGGVIAALAALTIARNEVYRSPIQLWQDTATRAPHNARAHCNLGDALCQAGQLDDGLTHFLQAVALEPHYALAHYNLGTTYYQQARYDEAADHLLEAIELKPDYAAAYNNLGLVFCRRRQAHDGLGYLTQATELEPDNGTYQNALGTALYDLRQYPAAIAHLQRAVEMLPADVCAHYNLANSLLAGKQFGPAIRHYRQTLELDPKYELAHYVHYGLGNAYEAIGEPGQALSEYQYALALKADHVGARYRLASVLHSAGRLDEAIDQYRQTLAIDPNHAGAERALRLAEASANRPTSSTLR